jgi:hypothetical protein
MNTLTTVSLYMTGVSFLLAATALAADPTLEVVHGEEVVTLDRTELETLPQQTVITVTPYFEGEVEFTGPALNKILERFTQEDDTDITFTALNDYRVSGSLDEIRKLDAIVATRMDNKPMSVRNRGPFWIILPLSDRPELNHEDYHRFMVWQLSGIELD